MNKKIIQVVVTCFLLFLLLSLIIGTVKATTETLFVEPMQDISKTVRLEVSSGISGSVLVENGTIDLFVTDPDDLVLFCYNQTENAQFNFTASKSGNYTMHLVNSASPTKVLVEFTYRVNYVVTLQQEVKVWYNIATWSATMVTPLQPPLDILAILTALSFILGISEKIGKFIRWLFGRLWWLRKYGKSRTPVDINPCKP